MRKLSYLMTLNERPQNLFRLIKGLAESTELLIILLFAAERFLSLSRQVMPGRDAVRYTSSVCLSAAARSASSYPRVR